MEWQLVQTTSASRVLAAADIGAGERLGVAAQAGVQNLIGRQSGEGGGMVALPPPRVHVCFAWPVAALAAGVFGRFLARGEALEMRIAVEGGPNVGVTGAARFTADIVGGEGGRGGQGP